MVTISNTMEKQHTSQDTFQKILDIVRLSLSSQKAILANRYILILYLIISIKFHYAINP